MTKEGRLKKQPIYIGGLGRVFTEIYDLQFNRTNRKLQNLQLRQELNLAVLEREELQTIKLNRGNLFVLTAGMMNENTLPTIWRFGLLNKKDIPYFLWVMRTRIRLREG
jgi:hypothetical protein